MERRSSIERERDISCVSISRRENLLQFLLRRILKLARPTALSLSTHDNVSARSDTVRLLLLSGSHSLEI